MNSKDTSIALITGGNRGLGKSMAVEVRYVRTMSRDNWSNLNYNEFNITENGFLQEFRRAQANLRANLAASGLASFAYTGAPGTSPLPIFLAYYNAQPAGDAGNPALYTGGNWTNNTFLGFLAARNPNPFGFASTNATNGMVGSPTFRANAIRAGLPENIIVMQGTEDEDVIKVLDFGLAKHVGPQLFDRTTESRAPLSAATWRASTLQPAR